MVEVQEIPLRMRRTEKAIALCPEQLWMLKYYERPGYLPTDDLMAGGHIVFFNEDSAIDAAVMRPDCYPERVK